MKKALLCLSVVTAMIVMASCGGNKNKDLIVKKWQWSEIKSEKMDEDMAKIKAAADTTQDSAMKAMIEGQIKMYDAMMAEMKNSTMEYRADGSYSTAMTMMGQTKEEKGTYKISDDGKMLITTDEKQKADTLAIDELSDAKIILSGNSGGKKMWLTMTPAK